jgi:hypothetical protein
MTQRELAKYIGLGAYGLVSLPVLAFVLRGSELSPRQIACAVGFFWLSLYIGARTW